MSTGDIAQRLAAGHATPTDECPNPWHGSAPARRSQTCPECPVAQVGYICKSCGGPSPLGVGYVDNSAGAAGRSAGRTSCDCGQSRSAS